MKRLTQQDLRRTGAMLAEQVGLVVKCEGSGACVKPLPDGRAEITLPDLPESFDDPGMLSLTRALLDHEAGHLVAKTPLDMLSRLSSSGEPAAKLNILNALEDQRTDGVMARKFPGAARNLREGYRVVLADIAKRHADGYDIPLLKQVTSIPFCQRATGSLPDWITPDARAVWDRAEKQFGSLSDPVWATKTEDLLPAAESIYRAILDHMAPPPEQPESEPGDGDDADSDGGGKDDADSDGGAESGDEASGGSEAQDGPDGASGDQERQDAEARRKVAEHELNRCHEQAVSLGEALNSKATDALMSGVDVGNGYLRSSRVIHGDQWVRVDMLNLANTAGRTMPAVMPSAAAPVAASAMRQRIAMALMSRDKTWWQGGHRRGAPDPAKLASFAAGTETRVMRRRREHRAVNTALSIVIDHSGSMCLPASSDKRPSANVIGNFPDNLGDTRLYHALVAAGAVSLCLEQARIAHEVLVMTGRSSPDGAGGYAVVEAKAFHERTRRLLARMDEVVARQGGGTPMYGAARVATEHLIARRERRKVLMPILDGGVDSCDKEQYRWLVSQHAPKMGVEVLQIGIGDGVERFIRDYNAPYVIFPDATKIDAGMMRQIDDLLNGRSARSVRVA